MRAEVAPPARAAGGPDAPRVDVGATQRTAGDGQVRTEIDERDGLVVRMGVDEGLDDDGEGDLAFAGETR